MSNEWQTPQWLFDELKDEFNFQIDLCASMENRKCQYWESDYLNADIHRWNSAFMNPPYSNPKPFIEKAWEDSKHCKIVCLIKCDPSTTWWATFWDHDRHSPKLGCQVRFFPKRIKFTPPAGIKNSTGPSFASALVIMDRRNLNDK